MAIWDKLRGEFIDIVEWIDDTRDTMVWRFPRHDNEIKNGAKLIVRESPQQAGLSAPAIAGLLVLGISILFVIMRPKAITEEALAQVEEES